MVIIFTADNTSSEEIKTQRLFMPLADHKERVLKKEKGRVGCPRPTQA
jgi:hypothetical protein